MAKTTSSSNKSQGKGSDDFDKEAKAFLASHKFCWVNIPLGENEKDEIRERPITMERLFEFLKEVVIHQYKLGVVWDNKHSCYVVSITGAKFFRDDYNRCVTSRHNLLWVALAIAEYKWFRFLVNGGIPEPEEEQGEIFN